MRPVGSPESLERRRLRAMALLKQGLMPVEVAERVGVDRRSVRRWKRALREGGTAALASKPVPGRPPKLSPKQLQRLEGILLGGARKQGFATDVWTCPRVAQVIGRRCGVSYHVDHVCRVLHALGWSPQKPERRAIERDEEAIAGWVRREWPRIKKKPANERRG
jgi:transposase